jgi:hypothetical protein
MHKKPLSRKQKNRLKRHKRKMRRQADKVASKRANAIIDQLNRELEEPDEEEADLWYTTTSGGMNHTTISYDEYGRWHRPNKGLTKEQQPFNRADSFNKNHRHNKRL